VVNFTTVACRISSRLKRYKNYKNRLRLAKVIVKNKMSRFYGSLCRYADDLKWSYRLFHALQSFPNAISRTVTTVAGENDSFADY